MNPETKLALALLFLFAVGIVLVFVGAGGGKLGAFLVGLGLMVCATRLLVALINPR